jgi:O-antigen ligase
MAFNLKIKGYIERINYSLILLLVFSMPLAIRALYLSYLIILLFVTWFLLGGLKSRLTWSALRSNRLLLLLALYYILHVVALIYTTDINDGVKHLEVKATFLLLPVFFIGRNLISDKQSDGVMKAFVAGSFTALLICIIVATANSITVNANGLSFNTSIWDGTRDYPFLELLKNNWSYFSYSSFSVFLHPSYFSMYLLFSIGILIYFLHNQLNKAWIVLNITLISIFIIAIFLLGSRAGILCSGIAIIAFVAYKLLKSTKKIIFIPIILVTIISIFFLFSSSRFSIISRDFSSYDYAGLKSTSNTRIKIWEKSVNQIKSHFIFGVGPGDTLKSLDFVSSDDPQKVKLNAHNQYLETFLALGLLGFCVLISIFVVPFVIAFRRKDALLFFFLYIVAFNCLFESVLERAAGVIFYAFFFCLFLRPVEE